MRGSLSQFSDSLFRAYYRISYRLVYVVYFIGIEIVEVNPRRGEFSSRLQDGHRGHLFCDFPRASSTRAELTRPGVKYSESPVPFSSPLFLPALFVFCAATCRRGRICIATAKRYTTRGRLPVSVDGHGQVRIVFCGQ